VWKSGEGNRRILDRAGALHDPTFTNAIEVSGKVNLAPGTYVIMCATFTPGEENTFTLKALGDGLLLSSINEWQTAGVKGEWKAGFDGGCSNNPDWHKNPIFHFDTLQGCKAKLLLELEQDSPIKGIGLYIFADSSGALGDLLQSSQFTTGTSLLHPYDFAPGRYIIMPSTFHPNSRGRFTLTAYTDKACHLA